MDIDFRAVQLGCHLHRRLDMGNVGVYAAIGQQTHDVDSRPLIFGSQHSLLVGRILEEGALVDVPGDLGQILIDHTACANIGVPHLAVAHLPCWQTYINAGSRELAGGIFGKELIQDGSGGRLDCIAQFFIPQSEAVHDNQCCRCFHVEPLSQRQRSR